MYLWARARSSRLTATSICLSPFVAIISDPFTSSTNFQDIPLVGSVRVLPLLHSWPHPFLLELWLPARAMSGPRSHLTCRYGGVWTRLPRRYTDISLSSWIFPDLFFRARFRHHVHRSRGIRGRPRSIYGLPLLENESTLELAIETQGPFRTSAWVSLLPAPSEPVSIHSVLHVVVWIVAESYLEQLTSRAFSPRLRRTAK